MALGSKEQIRMRRFPYILGMTPSIVVPDPAGNAADGRSDGSMTRGAKATWILAIIAHLLAWVVYLPLAVGLVLWPYLRGGRGEDFPVLATVFLPVALTCLALLTLFSGRRSAGISFLAASLTARKRVVSLLVVLMTGLAIYSISQVHLPAWAKLIIGSAIAGIAFGPLLTAGKMGRVVALWVAALLILGFCVLAAFSVGIFFLPAALASLALAAVFSFSRKVD